jgi:hypothetical protein
MNKPRTNLAKAMSSTKNEEVRAMVIECKLRIISLLICKVDIVPSEPLLAV